MSAPTITAQNKPFDDFLQTLKLTVADYADAKNLPENYLRDAWGLHDSDAGIIIPYRIADGTLFRNKLRRTLSHKDSDDKPFTTWIGKSRTDLNTIPYGLAHIKSNNTVFLLIEGESDTQTAHFHGISAVGISGADGWLDEFAKLPAFANATTIYIVQEPGEGGEKFVTKLAKSPIRDKCKVITLPAKDISELHLQNPDHAAFRAALKKATDAAHPLPSPVETKPEIVVNSARAARNAATFEGYLSAAGIKAKRKPYEQGNFRYKWILRRCPFNSEHRGTSAAMFMLTDGTFKFKCQHKTCTNNKWPQFEDFLAKKIGKPVEFEESKNESTEALQDETADDAEAPRLFQYAQMPSELSDQPVDWVLDGMFPRKSLSIVCGREGIGKGVNALLSVAALLNGSSFLGHKACFVPHILYVDLENPEAVVRDRLAKLGLLDAKNLLIWGQWNPVPPPTKFDDPLYMEYAKKIGGFIFFDSLIDFCNGADENNAAEMNEALTKARLLARHCAGVHIQHHSDKYGKSGWRGTTAITAAVDMAFGLRADDEDAFRKGTNRKVCFSTLKPKMCAPYRINYEIVGWDGQLSYQLIPDRKPVAAAGEATPKIKKPTKIEAALALGHEFILDKLRHQKPVTVGDVKDRLAQEAYVRDVIREVITILRAKFETEKGKGKDQTVWFLREKEIEKAPESEGGNGLF